MKNGNATLLMLGALSLLIAGLIVVGCLSNATPSGPQTIEKQRPCAVDGIRVNGTESDQTHNPMQTYEAWYRGTKLHGPSPKGNYWTQEDAEKAYSAVSRGIK